MHLVFYDAQCPFCQRAIKRLRAMDRKNILNFASLDSALAKEYEIENRSELVFYDEGSFYRGGKGILRILWRLGGRYKILGSLSFLPAAVFGPFYRYVANRRN